MLGLTPIPNLLIVLLSHHKNCQFKIQVWLVPIHAIYYRISSFVEIQLNWEILGFTQ